ncbi:MULTISPECIES: helix-turn-helix domain-containing protein [Achromobacter]|uniref:helix-turn-helix domain-containing protein n=1 Tax=Alcaligenes xylosoxydans xylosoxydans TaxID=85698 RepID=UPI0005A18144|nr:helix-turn-helix transcriptional regulator [Achromobacter xylosoxidans]
MPIKTRRILQSVDERVFGQLVSVARTLRPRTLAQLAKELGIHHTTLARIEAGDRTLPFDKFVVVQRHLERLGFEFIEGTRELALRFDPEFAQRFEQESRILNDPSMPTGTRVVHPRARSDVNALFDILKSANVRIENEPALRQVLEVSEDWCEVLVNLARAGRKQGIRFLRPAGAGPDFENDMLAVLQRFPFSCDKARRAFVLNMMPH